MAASKTDATTPPRRLLRKRSLLLIGSVPAIFAFACWRLTEPFESLRADPGLNPSIADVPKVEAIAVSKPSVVWPVNRLEGDAAKSLLLDVLDVATDRLSHVSGYTATFRKQERLKGRLGPVQTLAMKVRHQPFALYLKFLSPQAGKEVVYAEGRHDNKLIAHSGGFSRLLVPRLAVPPDHPLALLDSRHPVTEAGLANLAARLVKFRKMDLTDADAETILDRVTDAEGQDWLRSVHLHTVRDDTRPFAKIEVLYEPKTFIPMRIRNFDWPAPGQGIELPLAEHYIYDKVDFDSQLSARDFDPANPEYAFHRY